MKREVESRVAKLVPPSRMEEAAPLADAAGEIAVPYLKFRRSHAAPRAAACVRTLGLIGSTEALHAVAEYAADSRMPVLREVVRCAERFDRSSYETVVVPRLNAANIPGDALVSAIRLFGAPAIKGLEAVRVLNFTNCRIDDDLSALRHVPNLEDLDLWQKQVTDLSPLQELRRLAHLSLGYSAVEDLSPLQGCLRLRRLRLPGTRVYDITALQGLRHLEQLDLSNTGIIHVAPLKDLPKLWSLDLANTRVRDITPLRNVTSLSLLNIARTAVTDISPLEDVVHLAAVDLSGTDVSDISPLMRLPRLREVILPHGIDGGQVSALHKAQPRTNLVRKL
jgi:Leucine-rich repeat (LRR) protein